MRQVHNMKLKNSPFESIKCGYKVIELRLYDDKRQKLNVNDYIVFSKETNQEEKIAVCVKALYLFPTFKELFQEIPMVKCGFDENISLDEAIECMHRIYAIEDEKACGVVGIKISLEDLKNVLESEEGIDSKKSDQILLDRMK